MSMTKKTKDLHCKRKEFMQIIDDVRNFVNHEDIRSCLEDLGIMATDTWMTDGAFERCKKESTENPSILVAGEKFTYVTHVKCMMMTDCIYFNCFPKV
eukprot:m.175674 g.175674  ORF g.175674 m.175674 type:complete len:98 (+) comp39131_c2_seq2:869-1162(+)